MVYIPMHRSFQLSFLLLAGGLTQWCLSSATMSSIPHNNYKSSAAAAGRWVGSLGSQRSQIVSCKPALAAVDSFTINDLLCIKQPNLDHTPPLSPPLPTSNELDAQFLPAWEGETSQLVGPLGANFDLRLHHLTPYPIRCECS